MAYQNVGKPRFYIDIPTYLNSIGADYGEGFDKSLFTLNPITPVKFLEESIGGSQILDLGFSFNQLCNPNKFYFSMINHNIEYEELINSFDLAQIGNKEEILNFSETYNIGTSIMIGDINPNDDNLKFGHMYLSEDKFAGSVSLGSYYDMNESADLDLTMEIEFDGYNSVQTMSGSTLTNVRYSGSPFWNDKDGNKVECFSVGESQGIFKRNGRRNWNLKFSYISDVNLFSSNYMANDYLENSTDYNSNDITSEGNNFEYTLNNDDSFIAQVLNKVGNGDKFIFQPDNTNSNPDQFAICVLDQDSLSIKQVAYKVYDISLKIREVR